MEEKIKKAPKKSTVESQMLVIFGSNGDLSKRKLLPAIFQLYLDELLPENFILIGAGSKEKDKETNRKEVNESLLQYAKESSVAESDKLQAFLQRLYYIKINNQNEEDFASLKNYIDRLSDLSLIHISEPTRRTPISYAVFCLK